MLKTLMIKGTLIAFVCCASFTAHAMADSPKPINVPPGELVSALETLSKQAAVELVYQPAQLKSFRTGGVKGTYTPEAAIRILLKGTPLELRTDPSGAMLIAPPHINTASDNSSTSGSEEAKEGKRNSSDGFRVAQVDQGQASSPSTVEKPQEKSEKKEELQEVYVHIPEILVKGSRIMNVDVKRTEDDAQHYYILDSTQIEQSGAANVEDFLKQRLTMNATFSNNNQGFGGALGTTSSINLRGLAPARP